MMGWFTILMKQIPMNEEITIYIAGEALIPFSEDNFLF